MNLKNPTKNMQIQKFSLSQEFFGRNAEKQVQVLKTRKR